MRTRALPVALALVLAAAAGPASAQSCHKEGSFEAWLTALTAEAAASGVSERAINAALRDLRFDPAIVKKDRAQGVFTQDFLTFAGRMVAAYRLTQGAANLAKYKNTFARIEREFGVPGAVLAAFWGLETDFGANIGDGPTLTSLATLAYDCRRPELFRRELLSALVIVDRGDLSVAEMRGPWAGELGQVQFLASRYVDFGIDFDGDGRVDMLKSAADALASAARYLQHLGWGAGEPWLKEVRVPRSLAWEQADIAVKLPVSQWAAWGVALADGRPLPAGGPPASLLLPMGRNGPAFLAYPNFDVYLQWNSSLVYSTTAAYFATRLAGAPKVSAGAGVAPLSPAEVREVQTLLKGRGYDVGKIDGVIGVLTRAAVKDVQLKFGLPADSYPDAALLAKLSGS
ncbi:MAG: lytic murein transglycosylase [Bauldia sp.]